MLTPLGPLGGILGVLGGWALGGKLSKLPTVAQDAEAIDAARQSGLGTSKDNPIHIAAGQLYGTSNQKDLWVMRPNGDVGQFSTPGNLYGATVYKFVKR